MVQWSSQGSCLETMSHTLVIQEPSSGVHQQGNAMQMAFGLVESQYVKVCPQTCTNPATSATQYLASTHSL